jgi:hypothetical protein
VLENSVSDGVLEAVLVVLAGGSTGGATLVGSPTFGVFTPGAVNESM